MRKFMSVFFRKGKLFDGLVMSVLFHYLLGVPAGRATVVAMVPPLTKTAPAIMIASVCG
jgi:hypothetical protein